MIEVIVNVETGELTEKPYTNEQITEMEETQKRNDLERSILLEKQKAKNALLERLGITEDEAKLLLS